MVRTDDEQEPLILALSPDDDHDPLPHILDDGDDDGDDCDDYDDDSDLTSSLPVLSSTVVFMLLLAPCLKLGAMSLATNPSPYGVASVLVFGILSFFSRQLLYLLSRYLRTGEFEDLILDAFARDIHRERWRDILVITSRLCSDGVRILLVAIYLRESLHVARSLVPETSFWYSRAPLSVLFAVAIVPLYNAPSIASKRVVYTAFMSIASYVLWLGCVAYAHSRGAFLPLGQRLDHGVLWQGITTTAFAFTSSSTLPFASSLEFTRPISWRKRRFRPFEIVSIASTIASISLTLPLSIIFRHPPKSMQFPPSGTSMLQHLVAVFDVSTLLLAIPYILNTIPSLPFPERLHASTRMTLTKHITFLVSVMLSLVPDRLARLTSNLLLITTLIGTYLIPAILHIIIHHIRQPHTIVMPSLPPDDHSDLRDELLQRKERELQRRRRARRLVWDVIVWVFFVPLGVAGLVWAAGKTGS